MALREAIIGKVIEAGGRLTVRSALNPVLWLCAIVSIPTMIVYSLMPSKPVWLAFLSCAPIAATVLGFFFLLVFDRDKLQSEEYQIRKRSLELIEEKGGRYAIDANTVEVFPSHSAPGLTDRPEVDHG
jgi:hypothetical protein